MPRAEPKRPVGVPQSLYSEMEKYAAENGLFIFEAVTIAWEAFRASHTPLERAREYLSSYEKRHLSSVISQAPRRHSRKPRSMKLQ